MNKREILLRAHFGTTPSEDDLEEISCVETEIMPEFFEMLVEETSTDFEIVPAGQPLSFLPTGNAYLRAGETGTVCARRQDPARSPLP